MLRRSLEPRIRGERIEGIRVWSSALREPVRGRTLRRRLVGRRILEGGRRAKYLLLHVEGDSTLVVHLGDEWWIDSRESGPATPETRTRRRIPRFRARVAISRSQAIRSGVRSAYGATAVRSALQASWRRALGGVVFGSISGGAGQGPSGARQELPHERSRRGGSWQYLCLGSPLRCWHSSAQVGQSHFQSELGETCRLRSADARAGHRSGGYDAE